MESLTTLPKKFAGGQPIRPRGAHRINPIKAIQDREWRRKQMAAAQAAAQQNAAAAAARRAGSESVGGTPPPPSQSQRPANAASSLRLQCPNKSCPNPNVVDGTCRTCGRVADDSNIVAEVSFGENAQGAAVVQGSFLGHDQGGIVRPMVGLGGAHRRVAGHGSAEARERTLREARMLMTGYAHQLNIPEHTVTVGFQYYKLASGANFVQGRKIQNVVAVCLYAACRKSTHANPCKIMLIDLADLVKEEVFFLGRTFKKLLQTIEVAARDVQPIYVEDLIFRFAAKLEFDTMTNKVAETAVRLVQRMDRDWMVMGRRPAGICGACLIMAARMYNFRRTVREVVYIAKVTMATLQMRLDEFKELPSAKMTVEEFLAQDFLSEEFDPPSIYKKTDEYKARINAKKRSLKRKRGGTPPPAAAATPAATRVDADGFTVPELPTPRTAATPSADDAIIRQVLESGTGGGDDAMDDQLDALAQEFGNGTSPDSPTPDTPGTSGTPDPMQPFKRRRGPDGSSCRTLPQSSRSRDEDPDYVDEAWRADEENLEMEMTEAINSPGCLEHARAFASAEQRAQLIMMDAGQGGGGAGSGRSTPGAVPVSDSPEVDEDEFKDDPEVQFCLLSEEEAAAKEKIWMNENRAYLRQRQEKEFRAKMAAASGTKKQTRRRLKKPKIGEGQTSPASTPGAAAVETMERRGFSKRINYDAMRRMLDRPSGAQSSRAGSVTATSIFSNYSQSRAGSSAGSVLGDEGDEGDEGDDLSGDEGPVYEEETFVEEEVEEDED